MQYLDKMEDALKTIPEVSKINRSGEQRQQIYVTIDDKKIQQYGFDIGTIVKTLQGQNITQYSGEVTVQSNTIPIFTQSQYHTQEEIANQLIYTTPNGEQVRLKDIAYIERRYEEESSFIRIGKDMGVIA